MSMFSLMLGEVDPEGVILVSMLFIVMVGRGLSGVHQD
jgi:hypothetical protein